MESAEEPKPTNAADVGSVLKANDIRGRSMHFTDPAGMPDGTIVGMEDPGIGRRFQRLNHLALGVHTQIAARWKRPQHIALGVVGEHGP